MNGREEYQRHLQNKNETFVLKHPQLRYFRNYISDMSEASIYNYLLCVNQFNDYIEKPVRLLNANDFYDYMSHVKNKNNGEIRNNSNILNIYHALKRYGDYLENSGILKDNPMKKVKRPKAKESQKTIDKRNNGYLTDQEISIVINNISQAINNDSLKEKTEAIRDKAIIYIFLSTGIRCSALCNLDLNNYNANENTLLVTDKGDKTKYYSLNMATSKAIMEWIQYRSNFIRDHNLLKDAPLFLSEGGIRITGTIVTTIVKKYTANIEGKHITPHKLRATYGTQLYEATKDIYFVQKAMGHSSPTTTERYIRGQHDTTKKASDIMENLL